MSNSVYKLKDDIDLNELSKIGYDIIPMQSGQFLLFKFFEQDLNSELPQKMLSQVFNNEQWKEKFYFKNENVFKKNLGLKYGKDGKAFLTAKLKEIITKWRIQIDPFDDRWIGVKSYDKFDTSIFYGKSILDNFFADGVKELKDNNLIEEIIVEE